ncbi:MAG: hypothetical protein WDO73_11605 [Ignavibacteriota bacterium]
MKRIGQARIEWALLGVIAVVCAVLSFLQYRWTGELSRAEPALLRSGLNEQIRRLVQTFNEELRDTWTSLLPDASEIRERGTAEAHRLRYQQWAASHDPSLFTRIGVAVPEQGALKLYGVDSDGRLAPMEWPANWSALRESMTARMKGGGWPPNNPPTSNTFQLPVFADPGNRSSELEWTICDFNEDYIGSKMLPHLVGEYLNPGSEAVYDVSVPGRVIFSTRADKASVVEGADAIGGIFLRRYGSVSGQGPRRPRRAAGKPGEEAHLSGWTLAVRHREGSLAIAVAHAPHPQFSGVSATRRDVGAARPGPLSSTRPAPAGCRKCSSGLPPASRTICAHRSPRSAGLPSIWSKVW